MRKDIVKLVEGAAGTPGIKTVHLTTNGILFSRYAKDLLAAGLTGVNISLIVWMATSFSASRVAPA